MGRSALLERLAARRLPVVQGAACTWNAALKGWHSQQGCILSKGRERERQPRGGLAGEEGLAGLRRMGSGLRSLMQAEGSDRSPLIPSVGAAVRPRTRCSPRPARTPPDTEAWCPLVGEAAAPPVLSRPPQPPCPHESLHRVPILGYAPRAVPSPLLTFWLFSKSCVN